VGAIRSTEGNSLTGSDKNCWPSTNLRWARTGASGNLDDGARDSCLLGLYLAGSNSLSASELSEHKKGETNGKCYR
nr:hypothetical protein [Tanacetum cinerariifolium]